MPRPRLTYANVMSSVAVFLALGGVSYAAVSLPAKSVGSKQLKTHAVTGAKLAGDSVTGVKIKDASITGQDIKLTTLGKVPQAVRAEQADAAGVASMAASATSAVHADTADAATTAANADRVGGVTADDLRVRCPVSTFAAFGLCVESAAHPAQATYPAARQACSDAGGRTPTWYELDAIRQLSGVVWAAGNGSGQYEWTSSPGASAADVATRHVLALDQGGAEIGGGHGADVSATYYYRCVVLPTNR